MRIKIKFFPLILFFPLALMCIALGLSACGSSDSLDSPRVAIDGNIISWTSVDNADGYEIYNNGKLALKQASIVYVIPPLDAGTYTFKVRATSTNEKYATSDFSNEVVYTVGAKNRLSAPTVQLNGNVISWTAVEHAESYEVYEGETKVSTQTETSYTIQKTEVGEYKYTVKALSNENFLPSAPSNEVTYIVREKLATPEISLDETTKTISWTAVEHADCYAIYEDGLVKYPQWQQTSYIIEQKIVGVHEYYIVARSNNSVFGNSDKSNSVSYIVEPTELETPVVELNIEKAMLMWQEIEGAGSYAVYENGILRAKNLTDNFWQIPLGNREPGTYQLAVQAIHAANDEQYLDSKKSEPVEFVWEDKREPLATPTGLKIEEREIPTSDQSDEKQTQRWLVWDNNPNADYYDIYENGKRFFSNDGSEIQITDVMPKTYKFQVRACSGNADYKSSELSEALNYTINAKDENFKIKLVKPEGFPSSQAVDVALFMADKDGLPIGQIEGARQQIAPDRTEVTISYNNRSVYVAKIISGLPEGYVATEAKLSAAATEATITIYKRDSVTIFKLNNNNFSALGPGSDDSDHSRDKFGLFIAPQKGLYTISTNDTDVVITMCGMMVIRSALADGLTSYTFAADQNEAMEIYANGMESGTYSFSITQGVKKQALRIGSGFGDNANAFAGNVKSIEYSLNVTEDTTYVFEFTTAYLSNSRFVTVTIEGVSYEFEGRRDNKKNIFIKAGQNINIKLEVNGTIADRTLSPIYFSVYPLTLD